MTNREFVFDNTRQSDVSERASVFIASVENATPSTPVSLADALTNGQESLEKVFADRLHRTDALYDRHHHLFFNGDNNFLTTPDPETILELTTDAVKELQAQTPLHWGVMLGMGTLQLATAAGYLSRDPSLIQRNSTNIRENLITQTASLADDVFVSDFARRIHGDINTFPHPRMSYLGHLVEIHYDFWRAFLAREQIVAGSKLAPHFYEKVEKVMSRVPAKIRLLNVHALLGHPDRQFMRTAYQESIRTFQASVENGVSRCKDSSDNMSNAINFLFEVQEAAAAEGYSIEDSFRIIVRNSVEIGRMTHRSTDSLRSTEASMLSFVGSRDEPRLRIDKPELSYTEHWSDAARAKMQRRDHKGGICVARHPVLLDAAGPTHVSMEALSSTIEKRLGVKPPLSQKIQGKTRLDPAALVVNYALLAIMGNYDSGTGVEMVR